MQKLSLSIVMPTFNCEKNLDECLRCIRMQDYPQNLIEIIILDGGSTDRTREVALKYGATIINVPPGKLLQCANTYRRNGLNPIRIAVVGIQRRTECSMITINR